MSVAKSVILCLLMMFGGFSVIFVPTMFLVIWIFDIIELYKDVALFGIRGVCVMLEFIPFIFFIVAGSIHIFFCFKVNNIVTSRFMTRITSESVKVNREEIVDPDDYGGGRFSSIDDRYLSVQYKKGKWDIIGSSFGIVLCIFASFGEINDNSGVMEPVSGLLIPISFCLLLYILYCLFYPPKKVIFDRMKGEVTLPGFLILPSATVPFEEVINGYTVYFNCLIISHTKVFYKTSFIPGNGNDLWWSFYVWYMDRNRPLPKGDAFDPYRERDYERRKAEGFPEPLYPALYDTPEWGGIQKWEKKYNPKR